MGRRFLITQGHCRRSDRLIVNFGVVGRSIVRDVGDSRSHLHVMRGIGDWTAILSSFLDAKNVERGCKKYEGAGDGR